MSRGDLSSFHPNLNAMDAPAQAVPTIDDLRVKLCYICREEESADSPPPPPENNRRKRWTHPCRCTLVAHTACLLKWIQSSQSSSSSSSRALKCPQCDAPYRIESDEPALLKALALGNRVLQRLGTYFTLVGVAGVVGVAGSSIYICLTAYGAYALERFIGSEMFNLILTDDPTNWPWSAYINLPLIPLVLVLSRFPRSPSASSSSSAAAASTTSLLFPLLLSCWPSSSSSSSSSWFQPRSRMYEFWGRRSENSLGGMSWWGWWWPPPPVLFALLGVPVVRRAYRSLYRRVYKRVLGVDCLLVVPRQQPSAGRANNNRGGEAAAAAAAAAAEEGPVVVVNVDAGAGDDARRNQDNNANDNEGGAPGPQDEELVQVAEQLIQVNASSLGRKVVGALLVPAVSNLMGALLYKVGRRSEWVGAFLGMRGVGGGAGVGRSRFSFWPQATGTTDDPSPSLASSSSSSSSWGRRFLGTGRNDHNNKEWRELTVLEKVQASLGLVANAALLGWGGVRSSSSTGIDGGGSSKKMMWRWMESDPVWWRNCVGFAIFVAVKDAIYLVHLYLKKREIESRRVKDRDFAGIEVGELDLLPEFFLRSQG